MKKIRAKGNSMFAITLFLATVQIINPAPEQSIILRDISLYLPKQNELAEWEPVGESQEFAGEDLYDLINGGAVIYHEYGFKQVITQEFANRSGKSINLEIYEMKNAASAYGIYSFRISGDGEDITIGNDAMLEDYYLNFWKGNFLVTLTAYDSDEEVLSGLLTIAEAVNNKIEKKGQRPPLIDLLLEENLDSSSVKYLKGNVALSNHYEFDSENIFGLKEGVIGDYGNYRILLFKYNDENESRQFYINARARLKGNSRFDGFTAHDGDFSMTDRAGSQIYARQNQNYIFIVVGTGDIDAAAIFEKLERRVR